MSNLILAHIVCHSYKPPNSIMQTIEKTRMLNMFNNLRFMMVLDNFLFPSPLDLLTHCSYHFSTSNFPS